MSIHVTDFKYEKGKNEVKYIELLEKTLKNEQRVTALAVAKVRKLAKENKEIRAKAIDEFAERLKVKAEEILKNPDVVSECKKCTIWSVRDIDEIAEKMKGGATDERTGSN